MNSVAIDDPKCTLREPLECSSMPKVLLISEVFPPKRGGSGRWFWELYRRLPQSRVVVAASEDPRQDEFDATHEMTVERVSLEFPNWGLTSLRGLRAYLRAVRQLSRIIRSRRPETIHCGRCLPEGLLALMLQQRWRLPFTCYVHGEEMTLAKTSRELSWLTRRVISGAERLIANSRHTRSILERDWNVPTEKITVMTPGVDTRKFVPAPRDPDVRRELGWYDRPVILTVGALQKRKGQDMMIRALPIICEQLPNVLYAIVGEGWERDYLEALVDEHGVRDCVQFRGSPEDDELLACYQQCDLFALPNRQVGWDIEGFGIALIEAQACGRPVFAGNSGGTVETIVARDAGWIVDCTKPEPLANSVIEHFLRGKWHPPETLVGQIVSNFDWEPMLERLLAWCGRETQTHSCEPKQDRVGGASF